MEPENIIEICVAVYNVMLGIACPIFVDKISSIGDKYSSEYIPVLFNNEFPEKPIKIRLNKKLCGISILNLTIFTTLFSLTFLIFKFPPPFDWDNYFINNSAKLLVFIFTTIFTIFFFLWLKKVALYSGNAKSLLAHIIKNYEKKVGDSENRVYHLKAINELAFYSIEKQGELLETPLLNFYSVAFRVIRNDHKKSEELVYPEDFYSLVNRLTSKVTEIDNNKVTEIEHRAVSGAWLLGENIEDIIISEESYKCLWNNIYVICDHPRLIKMFWKNSSQYFNINLKIIQGKYDFENHVTLNQDEIDKRDSERNRFLEFHYALGGLLLYRKQYSLLNYILNNSQQYDLLPTTMAEIFQWYENFRNDSLKNNNLPIDLKYHFPELDNLGSREPVNYWIWSYMAILFLRQYSLPLSPTTRNTTTLPNLPNDVVELSNWLDSISYFERCLGDILSNKALLEALGYEKLILENENKFTKFISDLNDTIKDRIKQKKIRAGRAELVPEKIENFYTNSNEIISKVFDTYKSIFVPKNEDHSISELKLSVKGKNTFMSKFVFTDNDLPHSSDDTEFIVSISNEIEKFILNRFNPVTRTRRYELNREGTISALSKIISTTKDAVVVIGMNIKDPSLRKDLDKHFKDQIRYIQRTEQHCLPEMLYVLRENDLPAIEHKEFKDEDIKRRKLEPINNEFKIYASVIDINKEENKEIRERWELENKPDEQNLKVQVTIDFVSTIYWKNNTEVIQISIASEYFEQGIQNDINDIKPLKSEEGK